MSTFHLDIVTPDGEFFNGEAEKVLVRTIDGDVCILAKHTEYVTALGMGMAKIVVDGKERRAACMGGILSVSGGRVRIAATTFEWAEDIDKERAQRAKERAEESLRDKTLAGKQLEIAEAKLKRSLVRLNITP